MELDEYHERIRRCYAAAHGRTLVEQAAYEALLNGGEPPADRPHYRDWVDARLHEYWASMTTSPYSVVTAGASPPADNTTLGEHFRRVVDWFEARWPPLPDKEE